MIPKKEKLRIAFVVRKFPAMSESFVLGQITGMLDRGHEVTIFAQEEPDQYAAHEAVDRYGLRERTRYLPSSIPAGKGWRRLKTAGLIVLNLLKHPVDLIRLLRVNLRRKRGFDYVSFYFGLSSLGMRFDILHGHFGPLGEVALLLRNAGIGRAAVTTFHGYDVTAYVRSRGSDVYRQLLREGDCFTYNSDSTKRHVLNLGAPPDKMVKLPMGVDLAKIPFAERCPQPGRPVRILSVGRLVEMKGRTYAVQAVSEVLQAHGNLEYLIVGDGPLRQSLQRQINQTGCAGKIKILGWIPDEQLDRLYQSCHIFLHPSITDSDGNQEGQGVVLVEAQAYGLVVVATRHGAFPETVLDGKSGFLVPEKDPAALRNCLEKVLSCPQQWPAIGRCGRRHAETHYDIGKLNRQLEELYYQLAGLK